jgi:hypothetical protein
MDGDGSQPGEQYAHTFWSKNADRRDVFLALAVSLGYRAFIGAKDCVFVNTETATTEVQGKHRVAPVDYDGLVWCVTVPAGAFLARRNGRPFVTGNSGFPKSLDVSKALDKAAGAEREVIGPSARHVSGKAEQRTEGLNGSSTFAESVGMGSMLTAPSTDAAKRWQGWGTALKPAFEPVVVARKPLIGTVAANVLAHGTGALNIDATRVSSDPPFDALRCAQDAVQRIVAALLPCSSDGTDSLHGEADPGDTSLVGVGPAETPAHRVLPSALSCVLDLWLAPDSPGGCPVCSRFCGELPRWDRAGDQVPAPSPRDALACIDLALREAERSPHRRCNGPLSSSGVLRLVSACSDLLPGYTTGYSAQRQGQVLGRWPANVILTHAPGCVRVGERTVGSGELVPGDAVQRTSTMLPVGAGWNGNSLDNSKKNAPNSYGTETVAAYACAPGCPVAALDAQSGVSKSTGGRTVTRSGGGNVGSGKASEKSWTNDDPGFGDTGGASRFFTVTEYGEDDLPGAEPGDPPFYYHAKASRSERETGLHAGNMLCVCEATRTEWENEARKASTPAETVAFPPKATTESMMGGGSAWPTMSNGSDTTEPSRPDSMSTTSTGTSSIIGSKTSPSNPRPTTSASIPGASYGTACGGNLAASAESASPSTASTSTCPPKATPFTVDAAPATSERSSLQNKNAVRVCPRCGKRDRKPGAGDATDRNEGSAGLNSPRAGAGRTAKDGVWCSHPTVKPVAVMRWCIRLVTPPGGVVLDPFTGSGSTGIAAVRESVNFIGIEREAEYLAIAEARIAHARATPAKAKP